MVQWNASPNSKVMPTHEAGNQDVTISFSKARNHPNNYFNEESEVRKSALKQIL